MTAQPTTLPPFTGDGAECAKCSNRGASNRGASTRYRSQFEANRLPDTHGREHLQRTCTRCGYSWPEALNPPAPAAEVHRDH